MPAPPSPAVEPRASKDAAEQALNALLHRSTAVDWIYGSVVCLAVCMMAITLVRPQVHSAPMVGGTICAVMALAALALRNSRFGRSSTGIVSFVLSMYGVAVLLAHVNGLGIRTPSLNLGPVLLFVTACLVPTRVAVAMGFGAFTMVLTLVPATPPAQSPGVPTLTAVVLSSMFCLVLGGVMGVAVGRILRQTIAASAQAAQQHYQQIFSEQNQRTLRAVLDSSPYGIVLSDLPSGRIRLFNAAFARIIGRSEQDITGQTGPSLDVWADPAQREQVIDQVLKGQVYEAVMAIRRPDGSTVPVQGTAIGLDIDGVQHVMLMGRDLSEEQRRQVELQAVMDTAEAAIVVTQRGRLTSVSRRFEQLMGAEAGHAVGQSTALIVGGAESLLALHQQHAPALQRGEVVRTEHTIYRADGSTFEGRLTARLIHPGMRDGFSTVVLIEDITEQKHREQQLEKSREDALAASRSKTEFLARMSHELRTPLNGILGLAELAADPRGDEASRQEHLGLMQESGRAMAQLLSDILDISKIEAGRLELQPQVFELGPWLERIRASFIWSVESKGLRLQVQANDDAQGWVRADPVRLRQILVNYLANALKFTFHGEIVVVLSRPSAQHLRIEVRDTGMGIALDAQTRLFQPFEQTEQGPQQDGGTGLGLAICRELAQRMNGRVGLSSAVGEGSTFWAEVEVPPASATDEGLAFSDTPAVPDPAPLQGLRILLADDNRINQVVGLRMLERAGARVESALNGQEAVKAVQDAHAAGQPFDAVLMDVQMPIMDGVEATRCIRSLPEGQGLLIVAATAAALQEELDEALAQGMDAAITKPYDSAKLNATIVQALARVRSPARAPQRK